MRNEVEDCKMFIYQALVKNYSKRFRYGDLSDWDRVVRSIIKRKAIDYSKSRNVTIGELLYESDWNFDDTADRDPFLRRDNISDSYASENSGKEMDVESLLTTISEIISESANYDVNEKNFITYLLSVFSVDNQDFDEIVIDYEKSIDKREMRLLSKTWKETMSNKLKEDLQSHGFSI